MAAALNDVSYAEPSSDFPTDEDVSPCSALARGVPAVVVGLVVGLIAVVAYRACSRARREAG
ncbi:MAG TPA: hypothetical protein VLA90_04890 [Actinomycetota bacterium]|nr:hypothetical protein [Actinomycetota bacterium]